jgi:cobalamin synthase
MNHKQLAVLWAGIIAIVLMGLFPPWFYPIDVGGIMSRKVAGYKLLCSPPTGKGEAGDMLGASLDIGRLCVQWAIIAVLTGGLIVTFKGKKEG